MYFETYAINNNLLSFVILTSTYYTGAAHPNSYSKTCSFNLSDMCVINFKDLFNEETDYLEVISDFCIKNLNLQLIKEYDYPNIHSPSDNKELQDDWIKEGASSQLENFNNFCLTDTGLQIIFDPYSVGPYSWGMRQVIIPYLQIENLLSPNIRKLILE